MDEGIDAEPERKNSKGLTYDQLMKGVDFKIGMMSSVQSEVAS